MKDDEHLEKTLKDLEISSDRLPTVNILDEHLPLELNPFQPRPRSRSTGSICTCLRRTHKLSETSKTIVKRNPKKLKEPVFKYVSKFMLEELATSIANTSAVKKNQNQPAKLEGTTNELKTLLDGCERLRLDSESVETKNKSNQNKTPPDRGSNASCSQEAIVGMGISPPCDVTMDELASYFETFVHIPKKMSSMAEMMYI